jgi:uncharacterized delta-60 repeat protein
MSCEMTPARVTRLVRAILACLTLALVTAAPAAAAPGDLDTGFGTGGSVFTAPGTNNAAAGVAVQGDGKLVTAGWTQVGGVFEFAVERHNADGSADTSFGTAGTVLTTIGTGAAASKVALQSDGKLVVVGTATSGTNQFAVARYNANGTLDGGFGTGGIATTPVGTSDSANAVVVQPDGKIVVAGRATVTNHVVALARYNSDGTLDGGFGTGGKLTTVLGTDDGAYALVLQPDDKLVAAGIAKVGGVDKIALARYGSDGTPDSGFGTGGTVTTAVGTGVGAFALVRQPDGKLVAAGSANSGTVQFALVRYNDDGSVDSGFGTSGTVLTALSDSDLGLGLVRQPDGKLVVDGMSYETATTTQKFGLARYNTDGSLDTGFGSGGKVVSALGASDSAAYGLALQTDGSFVAAGMGFVGATRNMALVRYFGDPPDTSISSGPPASTTATVASFSFASSASGATFQCRLDGATWGSCSSPQGYAGLSVGSHTFDVRATYPTGNTDPSPASYSWTVTAPPPSDPPPANDPPASTPKPTPPPGKASIKTGDVTVGSDGVAPFVVTCGPTADCKGTVILEMGTVTGRKASISRRSRPRVVGRAKFSVKAGKKLTVKVKLAGSAKRMLRDKGSVSATLKITTVSAGKQLTASKKIKIVAKAARRSRPRRVRR